MSTPVLEPPALQRYNAMPPRPYRGPDRRIAATPHAEGIVLAMDELDHAILLLDREGRVVHANYLAAVELDAAHPLRLQGHELQVRHVVDAEVWLKTLKAAREQGLRRLISIGQGDARVAVSVIPLGSGAGPDDGLTLVMLGKRDLVGELAALSYARCHGLSAAEARIVRGLCNGDTPADLAARAGVKISTVRTQISSIRSKTGTRTVTDLVRSIANLPPLIGALRLTSVVRAD